MPGIKKTSPKKEVRKKLEEKLKAVINELSPAQSGSKQIEKSIRKAGKILIKSINTTSAPVKKAPKKVIAKKAVKAKKAATKK